jgi:hypothetical protein
MKSPIKVLLMVAFSAGLLVSCAPEEVEEQPIPDYSGSYSCTETTSNPAGTSTFTVHLKKQSGAESYRAENFYNLGFNYSANLSISGSSVSIPNQAISGFNLSGNGSIQSDGKIRLSYRVDDGSGSGTDNCTATLSKQ